MKSDGTEWVQVWDHGDSGLPVGILVELRVWGSLELKAKLAAAVEEVLEKDMQVECLKRLEGV